MANSKEKRKFAWVKEKYSLVEKKKLGELIVKYKDNDKELKNLEGKTHYDCKRKSTYRWNQNKVYLIMQEENFILICLKS